MPKADNKSIPKAPGGKNPGVEGNPGATAAKSISESSKKAKENGFPIVGVGASAGGLEAFNELLRNVRSDLGIAFVLVPHLDPTHASAMSELLSKATKMPVVEVEQGMRVRPNHAYVIPPGQEMSIKGGVLQLEPRRVAPHMPIDIFFRSLAEDQRNNAIGVILSGTASDGTLGVSSIKNEGGITFAQDSSSARYDGMPSSAAASGAIDFVLPPAKIAEELERIRQHPYIVDGHKEAELESDARYDMAHLFRTLKKASKVDFSDYKPATIRRRVLRRMALKRIDKLDDYIHYVRDNAGEAESLYQDLLINVTSFFRNPEAFEALKELVYPRLLQDRDERDSIRIWVPGCSTGEEVYSHAISIVEYLAEIRSDLPVQIFATDLSEPALQRARNGAYRESISADVNPLRLRRFFNRTEGGYRISKSIRDLCVFAEQNVFSDPPFSKMDIVSCRNLLIYLGLTLQRRVIPVFHYALRPGGFMILGNAEGLFGTGAELFDLADKKNKIYRKRAVASPIHFGFSVERKETLMPREATPAQTKEAESAKGPVDVQKEADRVLLAKFAPATVVVNEHLDILQTRGQTSQYLELSPGKASLNLLRMARPGLLFELQKAIEASRKNDSNVLRENVQVEGNHLRPVDLEVVPLRLSGATQPNYLIIFREPATNSAPPAAQPAKPSGPEAEQSGLKQIEQLKQELAGTKEYLQSIIEEREATNEELQSANEEIQSGNEELQSTNEELQTSKEELESANEELNTVNEEMQHRNQQLAQINNDLTNLLNSVNIAIVMIGPDLKIRRFTVHGERLLGLSAVDVGRPIGNLRLKVDIPNLEEALLDVIHDVVPTHEDLQDQNGTWYNLRIAPYRTSDNKIDGAVLVLLEGHMTSVQKTAQARAVKLGDVTAAGQDGGPKALPKANRRKKQRRR